MEGSTLNLSSLPPLPTTPCCQTNQPENTTPPPTPPQLHAIIKTKLPQKARKPFQTYTFSWVRMQITLNARDNYLHTMILTLPGWRFVPLCCQVLGVGFLKWSMTAVDAGSLRPDIVSDQFPVLWCVFIHLFLSGGWRGEGGWGGGVHHSPFKKKEALWLWNLVTDWI